MTYTYKIKKFITFADRHTQAIGCPVMPRPARPLFCCVTQIKKNTKYEMYEENGVGLYIYTKWAKETKTK